MAEQRHCHGKADEQRQGARRQQDRDRQAPRGHRNRVGRDGAQGGSYRNTRANIAVQQQRERHHGQGQHRHREHEARRIAEQHEAPSFRRVAQEPGELPHGSGAGQVP